MTGFITALSLMALVLSPLFIPIAVTVVHWIRTRRPENVDVERAVEAQRRAPQPKPVPLEEPA